MKRHAVRAGVTALVLASLVATGSIYGKPRKIKVAPDGSSSDVTTTTTTTVSDTYNSTLVGGYTPSPIYWGGRQWRVNAGSTSTPNLDYVIRVGSRGNKVRFELHDTPNDNAASDSDSKRRAELSGSLYGDSTRLSNGVALWGAMSFKHQSWADPAGMRQLTGGVYGQIHMGSTFGGSPAVAFRRTKTGTFRITTRGEFNTAGTIRYDAPLSFDQVHNLVYRVVLDPIAGSLTVWLDGAKIVDVSKVSIGHSSAESYFNFGAYFSGGISCPVVAEYANMVYPSQSSLSSRVTSPPAWPIG